MKLDKFINVIGLGYIGLPTALAFAANGLKIVGTDINNKIVDQLNKGEITFKEDGIEKLFEQAKMNNIKFTTEYQNTNAYIITVPTPYIEETKQLDPTYVISAVNNVLEVCEDETILILESTVSPGTIDRYIRPLIESKGFEIGKDIHIVHAPERIIPGKMIEELKYNSRTIGADDKYIGEIVKSWYESFCKAEIVLTNIKTAELSKVVENTYRDINIAFANELSRICRREGIDVYELINISNKHPRVNILNPGPGVGGHCISVDPWFLVGDYPDLVNIILAARSVNDSQPEFVIQRMRQIMEQNEISDISKVGIYGLTYKEDVDDMRESPTLQLLDKFNNYFVKGIKVYDPLIEDIRMEGQYVDFDKFLNDIDMIVIMVGHKHIKDNIEKIQNKYILDTKNCIKVNDIYKKKVYGL